MKTCGPIPLPHPIKYVRLYSFLKFLSKCCVYSSPEVTVLNGHRKANFQMLSNRIMKDGLWVDLRETPPFQVSASQATGPEPSSHFTKSPPRPFARTAISWLNAASLVPTRLGWLEAQEPTALQGHSKSGRRVPIHLAAHKPCVLTVSRGKSRQGSVAVAFW